MKQFKENPALWLLVFVLILFVVVLFAINFAEGKMPRRVVELPVLYPSSCNGAMFQIYFQDYLQLQAWDQENKYLLSIEECVPCN